MSRFGGCLVLCLVLAPAAFAEESLNGVGRITVEGGWRLTPNGTFYEGYYGRPENQGLPRARSSPGGPLVAATFAYAATELVEIGIDLFASGERLRLTNQPELTTVTYGALLALRFQTLIEGIGEGLVPFVGFGTGPTLVLTNVQGRAPLEALTQAWAGLLGTTLRFGPRWAMTVEYRLVFVRGPTEGLGSYNAGGNWLGLGVTYTFPPNPSRPIGL